MIRTATVQMPGTCGELVQGTLDGIPFHVTCPIDIHSTIEVGLSIESDKIISAAGFEKAGRALSLFLARFSNVAYGGYLKIESSLPRAKGMASSTADVAGSVFAGAHALGIDITGQNVAEIALEIEPTDGSFFPNIVLFDHRGGKLQRCLGHAPEIDILIIDTGGEVDTIAFNAVDRKGILRHLEPQTRKALELVETGISTNNLGLIGKGATLSARANQQLLHKPQLEALLDLTLQLGGLGVCVGHSGTVVGALWRRGEMDFQRLSETFTGTVKGIELVGFGKMVSGGSRLLAAELR